MFAATANVPEAEFLFAHATCLLQGHDPRELVCAAPPAVFHDNRTAQVLCTLQALAAAAALQSVLPQQVIVAGYSVGEVAAWGVAGCLRMTDTLDLVAHRAQIMSHAATPGDGLLFVRGLDREALERLCVTNDAEIAIVEPADAFVIGGGRAALEVVAREVHGMGARVMQLPVEVAAHTSRLANASLEFRQLLETASVSPPRAGVRLLSGIDGASVIRMEAGLDKLAAQISHTVQWAASLRACVEAGATAFLELGPGCALGHMAARAYPALPARCLDDFRTQQGAREWIAALTSRRLPD